MEKLFLYDIFSDTKNSVLHSSFSKIIITKGLIRIIILVMEMWYSSKSKILTSLEKWYSNKDFV